MSDSGDAPPDLIDVPRVVWTAAVVDPSWFAAFVGPKLVATMVNLSGGYLSDPAETARDALSDVVTMCEARVARARSTR